MKKSRLARARVEKKDTGFPEFKYHRMPRIPKVKKKENILQKLFYAWLDGETAQAWEQATR